jgi:SAM-dependent methyltransferase
MSPGQALKPPPGSDRLPAFNDGWLRADADTGTDAEAFLAYLDVRTVNWSEELEDLHKESSREHFLDVWTRRAMIAQLGALPERPVLADVGCSSGYLLEELATLHPRATLIGVDMVASGLRRAHERTPQARLVQADACALPLHDASLDAALSANVLEHLADDLAALAELRRVLRPGARAVVVVPHGPRLYDFYDHLLDHERRYARGELAEKARAVGLRVLLDTHLGALLYPPFWLVKKRNRRAAPQDAEQQRARVGREIASTQSSHVGRLACALEERLTRAGVKPPFGIRGLTVLQRMQEDQ